MAKPPYPPKSVRLQLHCLVAPPAALSLLAYSAADICFNGNDTSGTDQTFFWENQGTDGDFALAGDAISFQPAP